MLDFKADTPEYRLPIIFVAEMLNDIDKTYRNWKIKYNSLLDICKDDELQRLKQTNNLIEEYYNKNKLEIK